MCGGVYPRRARGRETREDATGEARQFDVDGEQGVMYSVHEPPVIRFKVTLLRDGPLC
jgi:hypothetical protein